MYIFLSIFVYSYKKSTKHCDMLPSGSLFLGTELASFPLPQSRSVKRWEGQHRYTSGNWDTGNQPIVPTGALFKTTLGLNF